MSTGRGRKPLWTAEEAVRVFELATEGKSQRAIAVEVFGDKRFRGRVERILGAPTPTLQGTADDQVDLQALLPVDVAAPELRALLSLYQRMLERRRAEPELADIERLLRIDQRLHTVAQLERLRALTHGDGLPEE